MVWKTDRYAGWGRATFATGELARPERVSSLLSLIKESPAPAIGSRRSYGDAALNSGGRAIDMTRMNRILGFDPETGLLNVEAGVQIGEIARIFAPQGWLPAVMPGTGFATVGGCIAQDVHGKNHHSVGSFGCHVKSITLIVKGKPKRITLEKNKSLFLATVGGIGQTGVILSAEIQLMACKGDVIMVTERRVQGLDEFLSLFDVSDATYSVGWIDATAKGEDLGRGILEEAETGAGLVPSPKSSKKIPIDAPGFALSAPIVRAFNKAYFKRVPNSGRTSVKPIQEFFFPLDKIHDWNRLYGKNGFHQFQCVLPLSETETLREMLVRIAQSELASPLAVLKRLGPGRAGFMSFPMEGYTLAVDFRNRGGAKNLIEALESMTTKAGGRIYLAKDSLSTADEVKSMYPDQPKFAAEAAKVDPEGTLETDMTRRLKLRATK